jgi:hypothetical protein
MDTQECRRRLQELKVYQLFSYRPETKIIPRILPEDETIEAASSGISAGMKWMLIFGKKHVYFIHVHPVNGTKSRKLPYAGMTGFEVKKGLLFGKIVLVSGDERIKVENCPRSTVDRVEQVLKRLVRMPEAGAAGP